MRDGNGCQRNSGDTSLWPTLNIGPARILSHAPWGTESACQEPPYHQEGRFWWHSDSNISSISDCIQNLGMSRTDEIIPWGSTGWQSGTRRWWRSYRCSSKGGTAQTCRTLGENWLTGRPVVGCRIMRTERRQGTYPLCGYNNCKQLWGISRDGHEGVVIMTGKPGDDRGNDVLQSEYGARPVWRNVEDFDPDPFMEQLNKQGLLWQWRVWWDLKP